MLYVEAYDSLDNSFIIKDTLDSSVKITELDCIPQSTIIGFFKGTFFPVSSLELKMINLIDFDSEEVHIVYEKTNSNEKVSKLDLFNYCQLSELAENDFKNIGSLMITAGSQKTSPTNAFYVKDDRFYIRIDASDQHYLAISYKITDIALYRKYCLKADVLYKR